MKKKSNLNNANLVFEELEPRLLLSADGIAVITESSVAMVQELVLGSNETNTLTVQHQVEQTPVVVQAKHHGSELVIIDSRAPNFQQLHNDIIYAQQQGRDIQVVVLDAHRDGIEQISAALTTYNQLDTVHIVSHGESGKLQLGATQLDKQTVKHRTDEIKQWQQAFVNSGDLLLYGCNLAGSADGQSLVDTLAKHTAADVAASDDLTGNAILGGDWDLEYQTGDIESSIAFSADVQQNWQGTLEVSAPSGAEAQQILSEEAAQQEQLSEEQQAAIVEQEQAAAKIIEEEQQAALTKEQRLEFVFIDESVDDYQSFVDDLNSNNDAIHFEIILLDNQRDGIEQISEALSAYNDVDAVHVLSHGNDGSVKLGDTWLSANNLGEYSDSINAWGNSLDASADILIYGCNLAESESGEQFVNALAQLAGADVAASDDATGQAFLGGDWELEYQVGSVEAQTVVSAELQQTYGSILASETVIDDFSTGDFTGNTGSQLWTADWIEVDAGGAGAATGNVIVTGGEVSIRALGSSLAREVDLSAATTATFSFDFHTGAGVEAAAPDSLVVEVSDDGGATWTTLEDINYLTGVNTGSKSYDISAYTAVDTQIRFRANAGYGSPDEFFYVDDVQIEYTANSAPLNSVPGAQTTDEDTSLVLNAANNNLIFVSDADAGTNPLEVKLTVNDGVLTLSGTTGLTFVTGSDGSTTMTFTGTLSDINTALDGLTFTPDANFSGSASLQITTHDDATLLASYSFDDVGNPGADDGAGIAYDGTVTGTTSVNDATRGDVLSFDGNDSVQVTGHFGDLANVTLSAWINLTAADTNGSDIISLGDSVVLRYADGGGGSVRGGYYDGTTWNETFFTTNLVGAGWHHIAYSVDDINNVHTIYLDGTAVSSDVMTGSVAYTRGANSTIGTHGDGDPLWDFTGLMDEVRVYDRALPNAAIAGIMNSAPGKDSDTVVITVTAVNDTPSDITLSNSAVNENINTTGGYSVGKLTTTDVDAGDTFTYSIVGGTDAANFSIAGTSFDELIIDDGVLDFEVKNSYQVTVRTTDSASNFYDETLTITVNNEAGNISGVAYIDEGVTSIGAGKTITMLVNGSLVESVVTGAGGVYSFSEEANLGDAVALFIDNDVTYQGATFTVSNGADLSGVQVFANHITVRNDNGGATSNADIDTALGGFSDPDIHLAVVGGTLIANGVGDEIYVPAGHSYTPGGNVSATSIKILGTINGGANAFTITNNWDSASGSWIAGASTVTLTGSGTISSTGDIFYNLVTGAASQVTTIISDLTVSNVLTIADSTGVLTDADVGYDIKVIGSGTPFVNNGATVAAKNFIYSNPNAVTITVAGGTYTVAESLYFDSQDTSSGTTFQLNADLLVNGAGLIHVSSSAAGLAKLDTTVSNYNITASELQVADSLFRAGFIYANNSTIDINGDVIFAYSANTTVNLAGSSWFVEGNWSNNSTTFSAGTSTVELDGVNQSLFGSTSFYNLTKIESSNDATDSVLTFDNTATQTINGTLTLNGLDADDRINLVSDSPGDQWRINLTATATRLIDFIEVTDSDASASDPAQRSIDPVNSINGGNNLDWFAAPIAVNDSNSVGEDNILSISADGVLANDINSDSLPLVTSNTSLNFNAANDGDAVWNDENATAGFDWNITNFGTESVYTNSPTTAYPGITAAYQFSGTNSGATMDIMENMAGNPTVNSASFEVWLKTDTLVGQQIIFEAGGSVHGTSLYLDGSNLKFATREGGNVPDEVSVDLASLYVDATAEFIQVVGVIDQAANAIKLYVDGDLQGTTVLTGTNGDHWGGPEGGGLGRENIGTSGGTAAGSGTFDGDIAIFRFYEQVLTTAAVTDNYQSVSGDVLSVSEVEGNAVNVGNQFTLASGALLTMNEDGSYEYDPNGQFEYLGDADSAIDSFSYTLSDGIDTDTATVTITINGANDAPFGVLTITGTATEDQTLTADASAISDAEGLGAFAYQWLRDSVAIVGATASTYTPGDADVGTQISVQLSYTDGGGLLESVSSAAVGPIANVNDAPVADAGGPYNITEGDGVTLDASATNDVDGDALSYSWDLNNDGIFGDRTGVSPSLVWSDLQSLGFIDDGSYTISVQVDDGLGGMNTAFTTLVIQNAAPSLITTGVTTVNEGEIFTLNLSATDPGDDTITSWTINWGDGSIETLAGNPGLVTHTYEGGRTFFVVASATDEDGTHFQGDLIVPSFTTDSIFQFAANSGDFVQEFGALSDGLNGPYNMRIGPDGNIYVTGYISDNVVRYDANGVFIDEFITPGLGGLNGAYDIAFGADGKIYIASDITNQILRYDGNTGAFIDEFANTASDGLTGPIGLAFDLDNNLYVSGFSSNNILRYNISTGVLIDEFVSSGNGANSIEAMTFGPDGNLYVVNFGADNILRYDGITGAYIDVFASATGNGLDAPGGLAFGPDGHLYVSGYNSHQIVRFDGSTGAYIDDFIPVGSNGLNRPGLPIFLPGHIVTVNAAPDAIDDNYTVNENATTTLAISANDIEVDNGLDLSSVIITSSPVNGAIVVNANGTVDYIHDGSETAADSFTYTIKDNSGIVSNTGTVTITVAPVNDTPTMIFPTTVQYIDEDTPLLFSIANANQITVGDVDANGSDLLIDFISYNGDLTLNGTTGLMFTTGDGTADATMRFTGSIADINVALEGLVFTPGANFSGGTNFQMWVNDQGNTGSGGAKQTTKAALISIAAVNDPAIIAGADTGSVTEDDDPDADTLLETSGVLTITEVDAGEASFTAASIAGLYGNLTIDAAGNWSYAADNSQADIQNLAASDTLTDSITLSSVDGTTHDVVITIGGVNDAPVAQSDNPVALDEAGTAIFDLATNDYDIDNSLDLNSISIVSAPANGSLTINGNGTVSYAHDGSETLSDSFSYTIADIAGAISNTATVNFTINALNDSPVADNDVTSLNEGGVVTIDLAANDTDADNAIDLNSIGITAAPVNGAIVVNADGTVTYTHDGSETSSDSFSYTIADISGAISNAATVTLTILPVNDTPTTIGIIDVTVNEDAGNTTVNLNSVFDDVDNPDSELTYSIVGNTNIGLFSGANVNAVTGELILDYAANMNGATQISMRATDLAGASVDTLFTVTVTPVNDSPAIDINNGARVTYLSETIINGAQLSATDVDNAATEVQYILTALPGSGVLMLNGVALALNDSFTEDDLANNRISYQVAANPAANDQFMFTVTDGSKALTNNLFNIVVQLYTPIETEETSDPVDPVDPVTPPTEFTEPVDTFSDISDKGFDVGFSPTGNSRTPLQQPAPQQPQLSIDPLREEIAGEGAIEDNNVPVETAESVDYDIPSASSYADIQVKAMKTLLVAIDQMKQEMSENMTENMTNVEFRSAAISSSGVALTAGVVAWVLRSGALMASLISTIPLWKGYDPLPILAYRDDEDKKQEENEKNTADKIPTSLEEMRKVKELKEKMQKYAQVDSLFVEPGARE